MGTTTIDMTKVGRWSEHRTNGFRSWSPVWLSVERADADMVLVAHAVAIDMALRGERAIMESDGKAGDKP